MRNNITYTDKAPTMPNQTSVEPERPTVKALRKRFEGKTENISTKNVLEIKKNRFKIIQKLFENKVEIKQLIRNGSFKRENSFKIQVFKSTLSYIFKSYGLS